MKADRRRFLARSATAIATTVFPVPILAQASGGGEWEIGRKAAYEWAARPEIMTYSIPGVSAPHYAEACMALGVKSLSQFGEGIALRNALQRRWARAANLENTRNHLDANLIGIWPMLLDGNENIEVGLTLADDQWSEVDGSGLTSQARFWIDDIYMIGILQIEAFRRSGEQRYLDNAALMAEQYLARLQQPNGLFHHGPDAPFHWARGNGWVAAGLAEILSEMPPAHPRRMSILHSFRKMMVSLAEYQRGDGLWGQLIDDQASWSEASGSAMFAFAMQRGVNKALLSPSEYSPISDRAWAGLSMKVNSEGLLSDVCVGTGQSQDASYYLERPRVTGDLHGQAPLLWLCAERLSAGV